MKRRSLLVAASVLLLAGRTSASPPQDIADQYRGAADQLIDAAMNDHFAFERLTELVDTFGPRFSGSQNLEDALDWILEQMREDGLDNVHAEPVMVPRWVRGN